MAAQATSDSEHAKLKIIGLGYRRLGEHLNKTFFHDRVTFNRKKSSEENKREAYLRCYKTYLGVIRDGEMQDQVRNLYSLEALREYQVKRIKRKDKDPLKDLARVEAERKLWKLNMTLKKFKL